MPLQSSSLPSNLPMTDHPKCLILASRQQYGFCHLWLPDEPKPSAGIVVSGKYYSFLKAVKDRQKSRQIAARLIDKGYWIAITLTPRGEVIWTFEPEAMATNQLAVVRDQASATHRVLRSPAAYEICEVLVPDLAKPLTAIKVNSKCYGLLRRVSDERKAIELANRLSQRSNEVIITQNSVDFAIWVLEPEAYLIN
jgi:hypothetical protein